MPAGHGESRLVVQPYSCNITTSVAIISVRHNTSVAKAGLVVISVRRQKEIAADMTVNVQA